jgi:hypothetical protein
MPHQDYGSLTEYGTQYSPALVHRIWQTAGAVRRTVKPNEVEKFRGRNQLQLTRPNNLSQARERADTCIRTAILHEGHQKPRDICPHLVQLLLERQKLAVWAQTCGGKYRSPCDAVSRESRT